MAHELRDELEAVLRGWNAYEIGRGAAPVIDYDLRPDITDTATTGSRLEALSRCCDILSRAENSGDSHVADRARADVTYLRALLGVSQPIEQYIADTQACHVAPWSDEYLDKRRALACAALSDINVAWGPDTKDALRELCGPISPEVVPDEIQRAADEFEGPVRELTGATEPFRLSIETTRADAYWHYWVDGAGDQVRLRLNVARARFTLVGCRQFALHEVLGHGLQAVNIAAFSRRNDVPWVRLFSVHAPQQILLEGIAQAFPILLAPDDKLLIASVRLDHYLQLVKGNLHLAINQGRSLYDCVAYAREHAPFWTDEEISDTITDRIVNPLLRSYLWSYGIGIDWFIRLIEDSSRISEVLHAAYREPLRPLDLAAFWPAGPPIQAAAPSYAL